MNRVSIATQLTAKPATDEHLLSPKLAPPATARGTHPHNIFVPLHYEPNYAYPLLVWLHEDDNNEQQLRNLMPLISMRNYVAVAPRGVAASDIDYAYRWPGDEHAILNAEHAVHEAIAAAERRCHVNPQRVFIAGHQAGGTMALRLALRRPEAFAGAISLCGAFPRGRMPLMRLSNLRGLPLLISHGRDAEIYSLQQSCEDLRLFHAAGLSVMLRQYPCGDELLTNMLTDVDAWLMERITGEQFLDADDLTDVPPCDAN